MVDPQIIKDARKKILIGLVFCIAGIIITSLSYYYAESGSKYTILYGAVIYGLFDVIRGTYELLKAYKEDGDTKNFRNWLMIGIGSVCAVGLVSFGSYKLAHRGEVLLVEDTQTYTFEDAGLSYTFPANMVELTTDIVEETDSTFRIEHVSTYDEKDSQSLIVIYGNEFTEEEFEETFSQPSEDEVLVKPFAWKEVNGMRYLKGICRDTVDNFTVAYYTFVHNGNIAQLLYTKDDTPNMEAFEISADKLLNNFKFTKIEESEAQTDSAEVSEQI